MGGGRGGGVTGFDLNPYPGAITHSNQTLGATRKRLRHLSTTTLELGKSDSINSAVSKFSVLVFHRCNVIFRSALSGLCNVRARGTIYEHSERQRLSRRHSSGSKIRCPEMQWRFYKYIQGTSKETPNLTYGQPYDSTVHY